MYHNQIDKKTTSSSSTLLKTPTTTATKDDRMFDYVSNLIDDVDIASSFKLSESESSLSSTTTNDTTSSTVTRRRKRKKSTTMIIKPARWIAPSIVPNNHNNNSNNHHDNPIISSLNNNNSVDFKPTFYNPNEIKHRRRISTEQYEILETEYEKNTKPNASKRYQLAHQLGMTPRTVQIWFQNKRAKTKQYEQQQQQQKKKAPLSPDINPIMDNNGSIITSFDDGRVEPIYLMDYDTTSTTTSTNSTSTTNPNSNCTSKSSSPLLLPQDNLSSLSMMNHEIASSPSSSISRSCSDHSIVGLCPSYSTSSISSSFDSNPSLPLSVCSSPKLFNSHDNNDDNDDFNYFSSSSIASHDENTMHYLNWIQKTTTSSTTNFYPIDMMYSDDQILHDDIFYMMNNNNNNWLGLSSF
ncbi:unnamed protein product [Cunninghamella echinulata]